MFPTHGHHTTKGRVPPRQSKVGVARKNSREIKTLKQKVQAVRSWAEFATLQIFKQIPLEQCG